MEDDVAPRLNTAPVAVTPPRYNDAECPYVAKHLPPNFGDDFEFRVWVTADFTVKVDESATAALAFLERHGRASSTPTDEEIRELVAACAAAVSFRSVASRVCVDRGQTVFHVIGAA